MLRLASIIHSMAGVVLAGSGIVVALALGHDAPGPILTAAGLGFAAAVPMAVVIAKRISAPR